MYNFDRLLLLVYITTGLLLNLIHFYNTFDIGMCYSICCMVDSNTSDTNSLPNYSEISEGPPNYRTTQISNYYTGLPDENDLENVNTTSENVSTTSEKPEKEKAEKEDSSKCSNSNSEPGKRLVRSPAS